ncbi:MAG: S8 family serine peptidase, partial [Gemmatimonadetes bacterium]|nr:S8 family serine peptidase [Gemmatimonadota bacterium]
AGVVVVAAAGNNSSLACDRSPASAADAFTIGATTSSDYRSSFSNYGTCVDIFAPGSSITSSTHDSDTSKGTWNGTSMAAPHAAGVAALYLDADETLTPQQVMDGIVANATPGVLGNVGSGSPNLLLYSLGGDPPPPQDPTLIYVSGLTVDVNFGKRNSNGTATVTVSEPGGSGVGGATVTGDWMVNGGIHKGGVSGLTETNGIASIGSGALKNVNSSHLVSFCVNAVTKAGRDYDLSERPLPYCVEAGDGGGEDPPPDPPADFTLEATVAGRTVVTLTWLGSSTAPFEVFRNGDPIGTTSLFWFENTPGKGNWIYQVCDSAEPSKCTNTVRVRTK